MLLSITHFKKFNYCLDLDLDFMHAFRFHLNFFSELDEISCISIDVQKIFFLFAPLNMNL